MGILGSDDQTVELAALVAQVLQLPHNPPQAAQYSHRKDLARVQSSSSMVVQYPHAPFTRLNPILYKTK